MKISDEMLECIIRLEKECARKYEERHNETDESSLMIIQCLEELQSLRWQANIDPERLTARDEGEAYFKKCFEEPCNGKGQDCCNCNFTEEICERLAAYEDTGLLPEQIREIDIAYRELCEEKNS